MHGPVLVVSSNRSSANFILSGLEARRVAGLCAPDWDASRVLIREAHPRAIVVEIERAIDWHRCSQLVADGALAGAPVIALTSWVAPDGRYRRRAFELGCAAFVAKPCFVDQLLEVVERVCQGESQVEVLSGMRARAR